MAKSSPPTPPSTVKPDARIVSGKRRSLRERIGTGPLFISVIFHLVLVIVGFLWVFRTILPVEEKVDFMPASGGGGSPLSESKAQQHRVRMTQPNMARVAAVGAISNLTLPEPDESSSIASVGDMSASSLSGGMGGSGTGGGKGTGNGKGVGDGLGAGLGNGSGLKNPFGMLTLDKDALVGTFYDLKQNKDGTPTGFQEAETLKAISEFVTRGNWNIRSLEKYYKAPNTLYQTKLYIPIMDAAEAPNAFGCGKDVQPVNWVALYRGFVTPPRSGKFRFVGRADNVLVIRFNSRVVLDGGDYSAGMARSIWDPDSIKLLAGQTGNRDAEKEARRGGYDLPVKSYGYSNAEQYNERGGLMVGKEFIVKQGMRYPVEILISELGGLFGASLLIEEDGVNYEKDKTGSPILPLFRLDQSQPAPSSETRGSPPYSLEHATWKIVPGQMVDGI
jgi:hypothetical protein